jgi:hypothetical protein
VVLNFSPEPRRVRLLDRDAVAQVAGGGLAADLFTRTEVRLDARAPVLEMEPFAGVILGRVPERQ